MKFANTTAYIKYVGILILTITQVSAVFKNYPAAVEQILDIRKTRQNGDGSTRLTQSENLSKVADQYANKQLKDWNIDANEQRMVLFKSFQKCEANEGVDVAIADVVQKLSGHIGLFDRFPDSYWSEEYVEFSKDDGIKSVEKQSNIMNKRSVAYKLSDSIQGGNQAKVFLGKPESATDEKDFVAIKVQTRQQLRPEALCYAAIGPHPGLVQMLYAGFKTNDIKTYALVLELMFADLLELLHISGGKFSLKSSIMLTKRMLKAASHIHNKGYVHRNLTLENVMVVPGDNGKFKVKIGNLGLAKPSVMEGQYDKANTIGPPVTMSTFTHEGSPPSPRDDTMSIWFMFGEMVQGTQPWNILNTKIDEIIGLYDDKRGLKISQKHWDEIKSLEKQIFDLKVKEGNHLAETYPELFDFVNHIYNLKLGELPNYDFLENCLNDMMKLHGIVDDGIFDWDNKLRMLFSHPDVLSVGIAAKNYEHDIYVVLVFENFYATLVRQMEENGNVVEVLDELKLQASRLAKKGGQPEQLNAFQLTVHQDEIENIKIADFDNLSMIAEMLQHNAIVSAGFAYYYDYDAKFFRVVMLLREVLNSATCTSVPVSQQMKLEAESYLNEYLLNRDSCITTLQFNHVLRQQVFEFPIENVSHEILNRAPEIPNTEPDLVEFGYAWKLYKTENINNVQAVYAYRKKYNFSDTFSLECKKNGLSNLSLSVDESTVVKPKPPSSLSSSPSKRSFSFQALKSLSNQSVQGNLKFFSKKFTVGGTCDVAVEHSITSFLKSVKAEDEQRNFRIHWHLNTATQFYDVLITKDSYYSVARENYQKIGTTFEPYQKNWKPENEPQLNRMANNLAFGSNFGEDVIISLLVEEDKGLRIYATTTSHKTCTTADERILSNISHLSEANHNKELLKLNPHDVYSVSYGFAINARGSVKGVLILETYCYEGLAVINKERLELGGRVELTLHKDTFVNADSFRKAYKDESSNSIRASTGNATGKPPTPFASIPFNNQSAKKAFSTIIQQIFKEGKGAQYDLLTKLDAKEISFLMYHSKTLGSWNVNVEVYS